MNEYLREFIINFLIGGGLIAGCGLISQLYDGGLSGMVYSSIPIGLLYLHIYIFMKSGRAESTKYALFSIIGGVLWVIIAYFIYFFNNLPLHVNAIISTALYLILAVITYSFFDRQLELDKRVKTNDFPMMYQPPKKTKK